ncbi:DMT family transporter [Paenibacillus sp. OSY-SE]|uniref:DMT family transporter n=1 Tax=Paenibacillus sp. OSY-SE TaxID=1196323 RepID=UPI000311E588|nr:DMT family transporter [Paenibacillus sp. OSY-SE]
MFIYGLMLVIASAFAHATWNMFAKRSIHKESFLFCLHGLAAILFMPFFIHDIYVMEWTWPTGLLLLSSLFLQGIYLWLVSKAYQYGDLSKVYPMMRGTAALIVPIVSVFMYSESLSLVGWIGWGFIVGGLFALSGMFSSKEPRDRRWWITLAVTTSVGLCTAGYTLTDKTVVEFFSPLGLIQISNFGALLFLAPSIVRTKQLRQEWRVNWRTIVLGTILSPGSYLLFLYAMTLAPLAHLAPIREFSIVIGTLLGIFVLKEQQGRTRIVTSAVVAAGMALISIWG